MWGRIARLVGCLSCAAALVATSVAHAEDVSDPGHEHATTEHGAGEHAVGAHGEHGGHGHVPTFDQINWFYGFLGEKEGVEPSFLWRSPGMPVPLGAMLLNSAILFFILIRFGGPKVTAALKRRREDIMSGMDQAARMKSDAEDRLADFENKLESIDQEIERVKTEMRQIGETERERILAEARERRTRMERDARLLVEQELKAARELLVERAVRAAIRSAETAITSRLTADDQQRLLDDYLGSVKSAGASLGGKA